MRDDRESNLPKWAQTHIIALRNETQYTVDYLTKEVARLRPQVALLTNRLAAMDEIMEYLIKGGHPDAQKIHDIVGGYGLNIVEPPENK